MASFRLALDPRLLAFFLLEMRVSLCWVFLSTFVAFTQLIELAGLSIAPIDNPDLPLITDDRSLTSTHPNLLWISLDLSFRSQEYKTRSIETLV